jgi:hypothetical protein
MPTITIKIASCGTLMSDGTSSMAGHMWFDLDDGLGHSNSSTSYGWAPVTHGAPWGTGKYYDDDSRKYLSTSYSRTITISQEQYNDIKAFATNPVDHGFSSTYKVMSDSCIDYVWAALYVGGLNPKDYEGHVWPTSNVERIASIPEVDANQRQAAAIDALMRELFPLSQELATEFWQARLVTRFADDHKIGHGVAHTWNAAKNWSPVRRDPLILDLDGDGIDMLQGQDGADRLHGDADNNLLDGGAGDDTLQGGSGNDIFIGGAGNDHITTGAGADIIAFNRGDGQDTVFASNGKDNTLSLGNGIAYADLFFNKTANDLTLTTGTNEQITFKGWYRHANHHSVATLQMMIEDSADYDAASTSVIHNKKIMHFDFDGLVAAFDQARAETTTLTSWALSSSMPAYHLSGSDGAAIGGDLAYQYAKTGSLTSLSLRPAQTILADTQFGLSSQTLLAATALHDGSPRLV